MKLNGSITALITPFKNGAVDETALRKIVRRQIRAGTSGLVPCGSTGEAAALSRDEWIRIVQVTVEEAAGKIPVIAGIGTNSTEKTLPQAVDARRAGADAVLLLCPYYNKPTQEGLFLHFRRVCKVARLPVVVYNIPGRTGVNIEPRTLARIAKACPNVAAVKEASGSLDQVSEIRSLIPKLAVLSGDDSLTLPMMAVGAAGAISVVSNILPVQNAKMCAAALRGDFAAARRIHAKIFPLMKGLFLETNPIPVKAAASMLGLCGKEIRLPLTPLTSENARKLKALLKKA